MLLKIFKNRTVSSSGTWGTKNENNYEILNFEFPEELEEYNKRIVYYLGNQKVWDAIIDNKAILTNAITTKGSVKAYIWCTKSDEAFETDVDFRTQIFVMNFFENDNADGIVPTEEQVDGFNTMLTAMNNKIDEVDALEQTIGAAEAERQEAEATRVSNENTRESNESTRQTNEQTRQTQEADRERRTDEAIADIEDKTAEYNANAEAKTTAFNNKATQKTNDFNSNATQKVNDFNSNAESKTSTFNTNATNKTNDFNSNASSKTTAFNENATSKTNTFNSNADDKTSAFNDNATQKTTNFDNNASEKTDEFNTNAQNKIDEYDEHIVEYQAQIDELQEEVDELSENMPWNTTEQATEIQVTDAAKYSRNKLELFGNTEQVQYTGVQLLDILDAVNGYFVDDAGNANTSIAGFHTQEYMDVSGKTTMYARFEALNNIKIGRFWMQEYDENYTSLKRTLIGIYDTTFTKGQVRKYSQNFQANTKYVRFSAYTLRALENDSYVDKHPIKDNWNTYVKAMLSLTEMDTFEPYTNRQPSPSPDYPQPIHVVTGENNIAVHSRNLFPSNKVRTDKDWLKVNNDGSVSIKNNTGGNINFTNLFSEYLTNMPKGNYRMRIFVEGSFTGGNLLIMNTEHNSIAQNGIFNNAVFYINNSDIGNIQLYVVGTGTDCTIKFELEEGTAEPTEYQKYYYADYPINLGSLELCKIGDYQDYLYKENGNWYTSKRINKYKLTSGFIDYGAIRKNVYRILTYQNSKTITPALNEKNTILTACTHFVSLTRNQSDAGNLNGIALLNTSGFMINLTKDSDLSSVSAFKTFVDNNDVIIYYILATPIITQITDETLISQLDAIYEHLQLVKGTNNITVTAEDIAPYMELSYMQDLPSKLDNLDSRLALLE